MMQVCSYTPEYFFLDLFIFGKEKHQSQSLPGNPISVDPYSEIPRSSEWSIYAVCPASFSFSFSASATAGLNFSHLGSNENRKLTPTKPVASANTTRIPDK